MRKVFAVLLVAGLACAGAALAQGITLTATEINFTNCASGGSSSQTIPQGSYFVTVLQDDVFLCYAATCASGGKPLPLGLGFWLKVPESAGRVASCRSANGSAGDIHLSKTL